MNRRSFFRNLAAAAVAPLFTAKAQAPALDFSRKAFAPPPFVFPPGHGEISAMWIDEAELVSIVEFHRLPSPYFVVLRTPPAFAWSVAQDPEHWA